MLYFVELLVGAGLGVGIRRWISRRRRCDQGFKSARKRIILAKAAAFRIRQSTLPAATLAAGSPVDNPYKEHRTRPEKSRRSNLLVVRAGRLLLPSDDDQKTRAAKLRRPR